MGSRSWLGGSRGRPEAWLAEVGAPTPCPCFPCRWSFPALSLLSSRWLSLLCVTLALVLASENGRFYLAPPPFFFTVLLCSVCITASTNPGCKRLTDRQMDRQAGRHTA